MEQKGLMASPMRGLLTGSQRADNRQPLKPHLSDRAGSGCMAGLMVAPFVPTFVWRLFLATFVCRLFFATFFGVLFLSHWLAARRDEPRPGAAIAGPRKKAGLAATTALVARPAADAGGPGEIGEERRRKIR